jgi:RNA polymerase sigma-70 factor (ECF subfamily)
VSETPERPLDPKTVEQCHRDFSGMLERYAWAIVRDWSSAADVVQSGFLALTRFGGDVVPEARKSWLFRVVHREALRVRERQERYNQTNNEIPAVYESKGTYELDPLARMADQERLEFLKQRISELSEEQQQVLRLRIFEGMTFAEVAEKMQIPIGTALSRMRLALDKLRASSQDNDES